MKSAIKLLLPLTCVLAALVPPAYAQTDLGSANILESFTPPDIAPGGPIGSFALSGFETVSPYGGGLSFALPLLNVGGRGEAGYTMNLHIQSPWTIDVESCGTDPECWNRFPRFDWWGGRRAGYSPGVMHVRYAADMLSCVSDYSHWKTVTRLTFSMSDGTEIEFRDLGNWGKPYQTTGGGIYTGCSTFPTSPQDISASNRGTTFRSTDGSAITFVSDSTIYDGYFVGGGFVDYDVSGYMRFPDGRVYRVDEGLVTSIRDRNGNLTTITYITSSDKVDYITDPLGRVTNVEEGVTVPWNNEDYLNSDRITYSGYGGADREILILYEPIANLGATTQPISESNGSCGSSTPLFQNIASNTDVPTCHNPSMPGYVVIRDGTTDDLYYALQYNAYGELASVTLPTGGKIAYEWDGADFTGNPDGEYGDQAIFREVTSRKVHFDGTGSPDLTTTFTRTREGSGTNTLDAVIEQRNASNTLIAKEKHFYKGRLTNSLEISDATAHPIWTEGQKQKSQQFNEQSSWTNVIRTSEDTWALRPWDLSGSAWWTTGNEPSYDPRITETLTTLNDAGIKTKSVNVYDKYNNRTSVKEYAYASTPTTVLRETATTYLYANQSAYEGATVHLLRLPYLAQVKTGGGTNVAQTRYTYDAGTPQNNSGMSGYSAPPTSYRGNVTKLERWKSGSSWIDTDYSYDIAGNVVLLTDPRSNSWDIDYSATSEFSRISQITDPLSRTRSAAYDFETSGCSSSAGLCGTGAMKEFTDENQVTSIFEYDDELDRLTLATAAVGVSGLEANTAFSYDDPNRTVTILKDRAEDTGNPGTPFKLKSQTVWDKMGRTVETRLYEDSTNYIKTETQYDDMGRVWRTSNPYRSGSQDWTETTYDALGRVVETKAPGNALTKTFYEGAETVVVDPALKRRLSETDALGRLIAVTEDPSCQSWESGCSGSHAALTTDYTYDVLDNLLTVSQGAQARTFTYDGLSRLLTANNPESGTITYTYDANGNLQTRKDARDITATNTYNPLNQLELTSYSDNLTAIPTPWVTRIYGTTAPNKNRLVSVQNGDNYRFYGYDELGRVTSSTQAQAGQTPYDFVYTYNLDGSTESITYPSGKEVFYEYDYAGRPKAAGLDSVGATEYLDSTGIAYAPHGAPTNWTLGNGVVEETIYNNRLQPTQIDVDSGVLTLDFTYGTTANNGNVLSQRMRAPGSPSNLDATQYYLYDELNRLGIVTEGAAPTGVDTCGGSATWCRDFGYDRYGNRAVTNAVNGGLSLATPTATSAYTASTNRLTSSWAEYDDAGNIEHFKFPGQSALDWTAFYDAENKQRFFCAGDSNPCTASNDDAEYVYDGEGNRVKKIASGETVTYVYDAFGRLAAEYSTAGPSGTPGSYFRTTDHLGSTRLVTDGSGNVHDRRDFFPFGEQILASSTYSNRHYVSGYNDSNPASAHLFTGKERDEESGLDYFESRYFGSSLGRFTSPDVMMGKKEWLVDPQRWSRYAYVRNNPLRYIDPEGEDLVVYTFYGDDLTDEQKKYLQDNKDQINANIVAKFKDAGVENVEVRDGSTLNQRQITRIQQTGELTSTSGIGLLNFADTKFSGQSSAGLKGGRGSDGRTVVFMGNLSEGLDLSTATGASQMSFRLGEVAAHELGHGQGFQSDGPTLNAVKEFFGVGNLMGEGQGTPRKSKQFDTGQERTQRAIRELNRIGDKTPRP